jgi:hypothetical protein
MTIAYEKQVEKRPLPMWVGQGITPQIRMAFYDRHRSYGSLFRAEDPCLCSTRLMESGVLFVCAHKGLLGIACMTF